MKISLPKRQNLFRCFGIAFFTLLFWVVLSLPPLQVGFGSTAFAAELSAENYATTETVSPTLAIASTTVTITGTTFSMDVDFTQSGAANVASTGFSVDYDQSCLTFEGESALSGTPTNFNYSIYHDVSDSDGEIDLAIWDQSNINPLPEGSIATLTFQLTCADPYDATFNFSADPAASFGDVDGNDVDGEAYGGTITVNVNTPPVANDDPEDPDVYVVVGYADLDVLANDTDVDGDTLFVGSVSTPTNGIASTGEIGVFYYNIDSSYNGPDTFTYRASDGYSESNEATVTVNVVADNERGDCNASYAVTAADFVAIALEILDGDDALPWYQIYQGSYAGSPLGCDANDNKTVNASDIIRTVNIFFGIASSPPTSTTVASARQGTANLAVTDGLTASSGESINVPITLNSQDNDVAAAAFRLQFDREQLSFDTTDANADGLPDAVQFQAPEGMITLATYDANNGYLDIALIGMNSPMPTLADGTIATVSLQVDESATASATNIQLTQSSLGSTMGQDIAVTATNGTLSIDQLGEVTLGHEFFIPIITSQ